MIVGMYEKKQNPEGVALFCAASGFILFAWVIY